MRHVSLAAAMMVLVALTGAAPAQAQPGDAQSGVVCTGLWAQFAERVNRSEVQQVADQVAAQRDPRLFSFWSFVVHGVDPRGFQKTLQGINPNLVGVGAQKLPYQSGIGPLTWEDANFAEFLFIIIGNMPRTPLSRPKSGSFTVDDVSRKAVWVFVYGKPDLRKQIGDQIRACFPAAAQELQRAANARAEEAKAEYAREQQVQLERRQQEQEARQREQEPRSGCQKAHKCSWQRLQVIHSRQAMLRCAQGVSLCLHIRSRDGASQRSDSPH
jgi:hypothetical protein